MRLRKRAAFAMAFAGISTMAGPAMTRATDSASPLTMKSLQGVSFDIGTKRAVSYFLSDGGTCKLTLMLAEVVYGYEVNGLAVTRMTVAVEADEAVHLDTAEGKSALLLNRTFPPSRTKRAAKRFCELKTEESQVRQHEPLPMPVMYWSMQLAAFTD